MSSEYRSRSAPCLATLSGIQRPGERALQARGHRLEPSCVRTSAVQSLEADPIDYQCAPSSRRAHPPESLGGFVISALGWIGMSQLGQTPGPSATRTGSELIVAAVTWRRQRPRRAGRVRGRGALAGRSARDCQRPGLAAVPWDPRTARRPGSRGRQRAGLAAVGGVTRPDSHSLTLNDERSVATATCSMLRSRAWRATRRLRVENVSDGRVMLLLGGSETEPGPSGVNRRFSCALL
jgi:hypothetical protein